MEKLLMKDEDLEGKNARYRLSRLEGETECIKETLNLLIEKVEGLEKANRSLKPWDVIGSNESTLIGIDMREPAEVEPKCPPGNHDNDNCDCYYSGECNQLEPKIYKMVHCNLGFVCQVRTRDCKAGSDNQGANWCRPLQLTEVKDG